MLECSKKKIPVYLGDACGRVRWARCTRADGKEETKEVVYMRFGVNCSQYLAELRGQKT